MNATSSTTTRVRRSRSLSSWSMQHQAVLRKSFRGNRRIAEEADNLGSGVKRSASQDSFRGTTEGSSARGPGSRLIGKPDYTSNLIIYSKPFSGPIQLLLTASSQPGTLRPPHEPNNPSSMTRTRVSTPPQTPESSPKNRPRWFSPPPTSPNGKMAPGWMQRLR